MNNKTGSASSGKTVATRLTTTQRTTGNLAFWLVVIMLGILLILVIALLIFTGGNSTNSGIIEYSKWALSTLLGAFGAWIGAGAAYFFGKENLAESSASTEEALRIQLQSLRGVTKPEQISDLTLTAMNSDFMFNPASTKSDVITKLPQHIGYWWVPVLDQGGKGILEDIIHAQVFWNTTFQDNDPISKIISDIDTDPKLKTICGVLHGASFFQKVALDDPIADVIAKMNKSGAAIGVVVDEKGKPTYCFTKQDLLNVQK